MGECNHSTRKRSLTEDEVTVTFHKVVSHDNQSCFYADQEEDEHDDDEQTEETAHLRTNCLDGHEDAEGKQGARGSENVLEGCETETLLCLPAFCAKGKETTSSGEGKPLEGR